MSILYAYIILAYWYDGKASLALILCTLLAIIFNEVMPKSLRVMDRFRRFQGHRRLYYVDAFNSFWRLAYRSRHAGSTGHFDAVWIINGCKRKDDLAVKCQSGSLALLLRQPGNLFRWGTSWEGWMVFPDPRLFSEAVDFSNSRSMKVPANQVNAAIKILHTFWGCQKSFSDPPFLSLERWFSTMFLSFCFLKKGCKMFFCFE